MIGDWRRRRYGEGKFSFGWRPTIDHFGHYHPTIVRSGPDGFGEYPQCPWYRRPGEWGKTARMVTR